MLGFKGLFVDSGRDFCEEVGSGTYGSGNIEIQAGVTTPEYRAIIFSIEDVMLLSEDAL